MEKYKRLTDSETAVMLKNTEGSSWDSEDMEAQRYIRLAELEDKIEQGELVSIPFIWERKNLNNAFVVVYENEHGDLVGTMFCGKNAKAEAEAKLKALEEQQNER